MGKQKILYVHQSNTAKLYSSYVYYIFETELVE